MAQIKACGQFKRRKITRWATEEFAMSFGALEKRIFLRSTQDYGLIAVICYLPSDPARGRAATLVNMCHAGYDCWRWYQHGVVTERSAARLVNRFLADWREYLAERGLQP